MLDRLSELSTPPLRYKPAVNEPQNYLYDLSLYAKTLQIRNLLACLGPAQESQLSSPPTGTAIGWLTPRS